MAPHQPEHQFGVLRPRNRVDEGGDLEDQDQVVAVAVYVHAHAVFARLLGPQRQLVVADARRPADDALLEAVLPTVGTAAFARVRLLSGRVHAHVQREVVVRPRLGFGEVDKTHIRQSRQRGEAALDRAVESVVVPTEGECR